MICGFFYYPKVQLPRLQKYGKRQSFVTKSLPISGAWLDLSDYSKPPFPYLKVL